MKHIFLVILVSLLWGCSTAQLEEMQNTAATLRDNLDTRIAELRTEAQTNDKAQPQLDAALKTRDALERGIAKASKYITDDGFVAVDKGIQDLSYLLPPGLGLLLSGVSGMFLRERRKGQALNELVDTFDAVKQKDTQFAKAMDANSHIINSRLSTTSKKVIKKRRST